MSRSSFRPYSNAKNGVVVKRTMEDKGAVDDLIRKLSLVKENKEINDEIENLEIEIKKQMDEIYNVLLSKIIEQQEIINHKINKDFGKHIVSFNKYYFDLMINDIENELNEIYKNELLD